MNKLLLFDIDGTLITGHGVPKKVFLNIIRKHFPDFENGNQIAFNGMTDPLIVQQILSLNDYPIHIDDPIIEIILTDFINEIKKYVNRQNPPSILPGVLELLEVCRCEENIYLGIVTGNMAAGAKIKLEAVEILHYFKTGAYGSDHWNRNELPPIAIIRSKEVFGIDFKPDNIWIIGDSLRDVECAKVNGLKCLAVETGNVERTKFLEHGADFVFKNLTNPKEILKVLEINSPL